MNIITGYRGEPHITSSQDRAGNQGSYGTGSYVLDVGNKLAATISSSTQVRIADGAICHQGCLANIDAGTYDAVSINNGAQGVNRIDLIVARYTKDSVTGVESIDLVVIQGSSVSGTPTPPSYRTGNIQNGDSPVDMPLYQVRLTGVTLSSVTAVFSTVKNQAELQADVNTLNGNLEIKTGTFTQASGQTIGNYLLIRQSGHVVSVWGYINNVNVASGAQVIGAISGVSLPAAVVRTTCQISNAAYTLGAFAYMGITPSGDIELTPQSGSVGSGKTIYFNASWIR